MVHIFRRKSKCKIRSEERLPPEAPPRTPSPRTRSGKRRVQFQDKPTVYEVLGIQDYTVEELHSCWYDDFEWNEIREEVKFVVRLHRTGGDDMAAWETKYPRRGLEGCLDSKKNNLQDQSIYAVLQEQERIRCHGRPKRMMRGGAILSDEEQLASVYALFTKGPEQEAVSLGISDAITVLNEAAVASLASQGGVYQHLPHHHHGMPVTPTAVMMQTSCGVAIQTR